MADVAVDAVSKYFDAFCALDKVSIDFQDGRLYALLGPSGSGKTTLLRIIAGFEYATHGRVTIAGKAVERVPVEKRDIGMMFQNYALFPNMSVFDNVAFGLTVRGASRREIKQRVYETLSLVKLEQLEKRKPNQLSGGQKQRVALARAIIVKPRVLLLDEPLSALDKALRMEMQIELKRIQREIGITTIFVTHDQEEALTLSDSVGILCDGKLVQEGSPVDIYESPNSVFAATFLGDANIFQGATRGNTMVLADGTQLHADVGRAGLTNAALAVRPEKMVIKRTDNGAVPQSGSEFVNSVSGRVTQNTFAGTSMTYFVECQSQTIKVFSQNRGGEGIDIGDDVVVSWSPHHSVLVAQ